MRAGITSAVAGQVEVIADVVTDGATAADAARHEADLEPAVTVIKDLLLQHEAEF